MLLSLHDACVFCAVVVHHINWIINSEVKMFELQLLSLSHVKQISSKRFLCDTGLNKSVVRHTSYWSLKSHLYELINLKVTTFVHLAKAFIRSDLQCIYGLVLYVSWETELQSNSS